MSTNQRQALSWEARASRRRRALLGASLLTETGPRRANILNLSTGGALLDAAEPPKVGDPVTLVRGTLEASGRVGWINGHRFGVAFDQAIAETDVAAVTERAPDGLPG
ncbi:MAG TPA: PilZ domain-containing protein [Sphingomonas sp.]|uniref:PilZ domain-containing protein n=1 Tax=Sphingomonas sp. TaxID=28214 RepID=UPI002EDA3B84